jgi:hypothetical protein
MSDLRSISAQAEAAFVPENDYPFFGYEPDSAA